MRNADRSTLVQGCCRLSILEPLPKQLADSTVAHKCMDMR
jgi:hypothetical protein